MKVKFGTSALPKSTGLMNKIQRIINSAEQSIVQICRDYYQTTARDLLQELQASKQDLQTTLSTALFQALTNSLYKIQRKVSNDNNRTKKKKLEKLLLAKENQPENQLHPKKRNRHFRRKRTKTMEPVQVVNLSSTTLSEEQTHLLSFGPKFCPTPKSYDEVQLLEDMQEGLRRVRLKEFWFDEDTPAQIPSTLKFYRKTLWQPPKDRDAALEAYSSNILTRTTSYVPQPPKHQNISRASRLALSQLKKMVQDRTIRISTADKGGAIVVQDFDQYCQEAHRQLNNPTHYERLQTDPTKDIAATSNEFFKELYNRDIINEKTMEWGLINKDCQNPHLLPPPENP
jgi:hypothetical protein